MTVGNLIASNLAAALILWFVVAVSRSHTWTNPKTGRPQTHHFYYGLALYAVGWALLSSHPWIALLLLGIGVWWMADDCNQHDHQITDPAYRSPMHRLFARYLYTPFVRRTK